MIAEKLPRHIRSFLFNYLDYQLWLKCQQDSWNEEWGPKSVINSFKFTSRSSIEHYSPQHPKSGFAPLDDQFLHNFGNLCLISSSKNAELSNYSPIAKKDHYLKNNVRESLKQSIMLYLTKDDKSWDSELIIAHGVAMKQVLYPNYEPTEFEREFLTPPFAPQ